MSVKAILDEKGRNVVTVGPQMTVQQAAILLRDNHIGAVIIVDADDQIAGILTERDIVAAIAKQERLVSKGRSRLSCGRTSTAAPRKCPSSP